MIGQLICKDGSNSAIQTSETAFLNCSLPEVWRFRTFRPSCQAVSRGGSAACPLVGGGHSEGDGVQLRACASAALVPICPYSQDRTP